MTDQDSGIEQIILKLGDCFVFKIPPLRSASGHRAESWDLEKPLFIGYLRMYQNDKKLIVRIYKFTNTYSKDPTDENIAFFSECPVEIQPRESITAYIDNVVDSSRYFVLKMKDKATGRTAQMGIGWLDRDPAFEFKSCLNEYIRYVDRMLSAERRSQVGLEDEKHEEGVTVFQNDNQDDEDDDYQMTSTSSSSNSHQQMNREKLDLAIKPGSKIAIKSLGVHRTINKHSHSTENSTDQINTATTANLSTFALAPPPLLPPPTVSVFNKIDSTNKDSSNNNVISETDWGDFESAN